MAHSICSIADCVSAPIAKGLCNAHYRRWRRAPDGPIQPAPKPPKPQCSVEGCDSLTKGRGLCGMHYKRMSDHGSTELPRRTPPTAKTCSSCGFTGPAELFARNRRRCFDCRRAENANWRQENAEYVREKQREWRLSNQEWLKAYREENLERIQETARLRVERNPRKYADYRQQWREANLERDRENARRWRAAHRSELVARAMERYWATRSPAEMADLVVERVAYYGGKCWICKTADYEHIDHVKPLAKGGPHIPANLRPACARCNQSKRDKWPFSPARELAA